MKQAPEITKSDLVTYGNFLDEASLPTDADKLIRFASDIIMNIVKYNYNPLSESHVLAVKKAACSQVSYWVETGTTPVNEAGTSSYSLGEISMSIATPQGSSVPGSLTLCSLALMYLRGEHLLYRGMRHGRI